MKIEEGVRNTRTRRRMAGFTASEDHNIKNPI
jgi:hypothetical protein